MDAFSAIATTKNVDHPFSTKRLMRHFHDSVA
jgi:hypothetical protein